MWEMVEVNIKVDEGVNPVVDRWYREYEDGPDGTRVYGQRITAEEYDQRFKPLHQKIWDAIKTPFGGL